ncbi:MAG: M48 family metallopeptidase [Bifidobacteriaceae bacterium]|jgi:predicted metal-dependent hydrolase|nr:M48 family metallopeptidase [Bifidobacteriaceae bacterium]
MKPDETIKVGGFSVEVRRKRVKSIHLHVEPSGHLWLSAPYRCPTAALTKMVADRLVWVRRQMAQFDELRATPRLWGTPLDDAVPPLALDALYRRELAQAAAGLAAHYEPLVGRSASAWRFRWMKTRWGSCHPATGRITLNLALAALPSIYLHQVVVHELVHLRASGHGPEFYRLMDLYMPTWRSVRRAMRGIVPLRPT